MNQQIAQSHQESAIELAVIINSFNRLLLLREAISSIIQVLTLTFPNQSAVVVFDAGSTDGSQEFIEDCAANTQALHITYLFPSVNIDRSFSAGCNLAVKTAANKFPQLKWCLFFETDNLITNPASLLLAVKLLEQEDELAAVGFTVEGAAFCSRFPKPLAFVLGLQVSHRLGLERMQISRWYPFHNSRWGFSDIVYTSPLLVRYSAWQATDGMDTARFPFSDCDSDWCWMVHKKGWRIAVLDVHGVIHDNRRIQSEWSGQRVLNFHQARLRLLYKHKGKWIGVLKYILFVRHCLELLILILKAIRFEQAKKSLIQRIYLLKTVWQDYTESI